MKLPTFSVAAAAILAFAPFAAGCAGEDAEAMDAQYPSPASPPVGYDSTTEYAQAQAQTAQGTPNPAQAQPIEGTEEMDGNGEGASGAPPPEQVSAGADDEEYADTDPSALTDFHQTLDPYGEWVDDANYGTVWVPSSGVVGDDFTPYVSGGHWTYDDDYTWVSDYSWGWAPFHYGRWLYMGGRGWGWVPGRQYAGAWVSWRMGYGDWGYVGWAPMPPTWYWRGGYAYGLGHVPYGSYTFCANGDLFHPAIAHHVVAGSQVGVIAGHTQPYAAHPGVGAGAHVGAHPGVGGPPPGMLHIAPNAVARAPAGNPGLAQARGFSRPSTAGALGGRPPVQTLGRSNGAVASNFGRSGPGVPSYHPGYTQGYHPGYSGGYSRGYSSGYAGTGGGYHPSYSTGTRGYSGGYSGGYSRGYSGGYSGGYAGGYRPSSPYSSPSYHPSVPSSGGRGRRSSSSSEPVFGGHSSGGGYSGGGGFRGGGFSGGGFRGGGGGGGRHR